MKKSKLLVVVLLLVIIILVANQFVLADYNTAVSWCDGWGGTLSYIGRGTDPKYGDFDLYACSNAFSAEAVRVLGCGQEVTNIRVYDNNNVTGYFLGDCGTEEKTLVERGVAKINTIPTEVYLGGTIKVTGMGAPSFLRLKGNGTTYKLPVVPGSVKQLEDGTFTAEFYTIDPTTSQPLVAPGTYKADIFGSNGPAGKQFDITITR